MNMDMDALKLKLRTVEFKITGGTEELYHEAFKNVFDGMFGAKKKQYILNTFGVMACTTCKLSVLLNDADFFNLKTKVLNTFELKDLTFGTEEL